MKIVQKALGFVARKINTLSQSQNIGLAEGEVTPGMPELVRAAAAEGAVLLKNNGVLPVSKEQTVSLFGRVQVNTFFVGYGSGGDVNAPYKINYLEGIKNCENITLNTQLADIICEEVVFPQLESIKKAHEKGILIGAGTDTLGSMCDELLILEKAGLSTYEALQTATINAAKIVENEMIGTVECGKIADLVLLDANPLDDLNNLRNVNTVIFDGEIVNESWMCNLQ